MNPHLSPARRRKKVLRLPRLLALLLAVLTASSLLTASATATCNFILKWGSTGSGSGQFITPRGIAVDSSGNVYVPDQNTRVQKFDSSGNLISQFGIPGDVPGGFVTPNKVATDSAGNVYVTDNFNNRVSKFSSSGTFLLTWTGGSGGIAIDSSNNVYVTDPITSVIRKFSSTGTLLLSWGGAGSGDGQLSGPNDVAVDSSGNVYVMDTGNSRVQKFSSTGAFITKWGSAGSGDGQFNGSTGIGVDSSGTVYVADTGNNRIQKFDSNGTFLEACGTLGSGDGQFSAPAGVAADSTGNYYVVDRDNDRVQKFGAAAADPIADAGEDQTVECAGSLTSVTLDGTGSTPGSGTINSYTWTEGATTLGSGDTLVVSLPPGSHTITLTVTDTGGGSDSDDVVIDIVDTTPPVINCPANVVVTLPPNSTDTSAVVNYPAVTATDDCSSSVTVNSTPASGSVFPLGTTTVNATANDGTHTSGCSFTVTVSYNFTGFFPPVNNLPAVNVVNAGRAIPVKFSLSGNKGLNIFAPNSPSSGTIACNSSDPAVTLEDTVTAGGSSLTYDAASDQYVYVWKTDPSWAGTCRQLVVTLNDGSIHRANFRFK
ncbi:MAG TPA: PxKF domain-containing protein [Pyrinomonadaceae bacterium]|nr:PxKF domain-containing protein [Pyrinomonadaceae bacterium]